MLALMSWPLRYWHSCLEKVLLPDAGKPTSMTMVLSMSFLWMRSWRSVILRSWWISVMDDTLCGVSATVVAWVAGEESNNEFMELVLVERKLRPLE